RPQPPAPGGGAVLQRLHGSPPGPGGLLPRAESDSVFGVGCHPQPALLARVRADSRVLRPYATAQRTRTPASERDESDDFEQPSGIAAARTGRARTGGGARADGGGVR